MIGIDAMSQLDAISQLMMSVTEPAARIVGWTLLHFVWQGALIGVLTAAALTLLRRSAADVRYVVATIAMSLMLTMPVMTGTQLWRAAAFERASVSAPPAAGPSSAAAQLATDAGAATAAGPAVVTARASLTTAAAAAVERVRIEPWLPVVVLVWLCGVVILSLRLMSGWLWVQRMKSHGTVAADAGWRHIAARLSKRLHISRPVTLLHSTLVDVPTVIGWMKPVILLPVSALAGLTQHQLEAILAHELAHIRRHDYLVNLVQTLVETLLFYHPAVWWLSRRIRVERENCCDDLAVSLCGDPFVYAKALADLEQLRGASGRLVMAASGGSLVQRVRRLLGAPTHAGRAPGWLAGSAAILVMLVTAAGAIGTDAFQSASVPVPAPRPPQTAVLAELPSVAASAAAVVAQETGCHTGPLEPAQHAAEAARSVPLRCASPLPTVRSAGLAPRESEPVLSPTPPLPPLASADHSLTEVRQALAAVQEAQAHALPALAQALPEIATAAAIGRGQSHGTFSWSSNGEKLEIRYDGEFEFTDDDTDVPRRITLPSF